ncbi:MAG: hypothetical protein K2J38_06820 [Muribaculaceae bacterium]|nr:hypothetical protein [Muribaculaceae bacterium]
MALIKGAQTREIEELRKVESSIRRNRRCERVHHIIIAVLGVLLVSSVVTGHIRWRK